MFNIPKLEKESFYIDSAIEAMQQHATNEKDKIEERYKKTASTKDKTIDENRLNKRKDLELEKIRFLNMRLNQSLKKIIKQYPKFKKIDDIYIKLINTSPVKVADIEDSVKRLQWIALSIDQFTQNTEVKIKRTKSQQTVGFLMKKYLGKVNSLFSKNKQHFKNLEEARRYLNKMPTFEPIFTVSIGGFPNVGKSTLMQKITGSEVEIQNYPFTTKGLMFGYIKQGQAKTVQLIDTPGLLGRDKQNEIEQRAQIVINDFSDIIIFVIDFTETCGFDIKSQIKLLKRTRDIGKPIVIYLSKTDIFNEEDKERIEEYNSQIKKFKVFKNAEEIKKYIIDEKTKNKKFNIKDIHIIK